MPSPQLITNGDWLSVPWAVYTGSGAGDSGQDTTLGWDGNQASLTIMVNWEDGALAANELTGSAIYNSATNNLDRRSPVPHLIWPHLVCTRIASMRPYRFEGKEPVIAGLFGNAFIAAVPRHTFWLIGCTFTQPRYRILTDAFLDTQYGAPRAEYQRYLSWNIEPASEVLTRDINSFKYAEGGAAGQEFPGQVAQFLSKSEVIFRWWNVPRVGLFSDGGQGPPTNILLGEGKINKDDFLGFKAGTLLLKATRFIEHDAPTVLSVTASGAGSPPLAYDVEFICGYFDPPNYPTGTGRRGWNLIPRVGDDLWYYATVDGNPASAGILREYEFAGLFDLQD